MNNKVELSDGAIVMSIGTLEWWIKEDDAANIDFTKMRITGVGDMDEDRKLATAQYTIGLQQITSNYEDYIKQALLYVTHHVLMVLRETNFDGRVLLVYAKHQLQWDAKIQCNAYLYPIEITVSK